MKQQSSDAVVVANNVWKIFGTGVKEAMQAVLKENLTKAEVLEQYQPVASVRDVSISVGEGEVFCIMGLSASGKSALARHINRLIEPTSGETLINGLNVGKLGAEGLRQLRAQKIGMVFQNMALLPHRTVRDNIAFARAKMADRVIELVSLQGYGVRLSADLPGGMQQRVGLARAMAADPDILLMDEPF